MISAITCPYCLAQSSHAVPEQACLFFLECPVCQKVMRPLPGDCCVFCSYGDQECPSRGTPMGP